MSAEAVAEAVAEAAAKSARLPARKRTPTVLQMEAAECGAACLAMVLGYYGRYVPLEQLRAECGVSRDGSKASNLVLVARKYGMDARGFKKEPDGMRSIPLPAIIFWNFNHFIVLEGFGTRHTSLIPGRPVEDVVYLNDPASGPRTISAQEFDESFTGVVLAFKPMEEFQKGGQRPNPLLALKKRLSGSWAGLVWAVLAGLGLILPGLAVPMLSRAFVDQYLVAGMRSWVGPLIFGLLLAAALRGGLAWLQEACLLRLEMRLSSAMSSQFFWHLLRLPVEFYNQRYGGEVGNRLALNDKLARLLTGDLASIIINGCLVIFYTLLMVQYSPPLTLVGIFIAALNLTGLRYIARQRSDANQALIQENGKLVATAMNGLQTIETIKATGSELDFFWRWAGRQAKVANVQQKMEATTQVLQALPGMLYSLNTLAILGLGALQIMDGRMTLGQLVAFQSLMASFLWPIDELVGQAGALQEVQGDLASLDDVLRHPIDSAVESAACSVTGSEAGSANHLSGRIEIRDLTFGYNRLEAPLIENFCLTVQPGRRVALVGSSGSGKSTISRLVAGLYQPWSGEILLDGKPRQAISRQVLNHDLALVDQDIFLFEGSVRENLTLWQTEAPEADLVRAGIDASIHDDIQSRAGGYDGLVEEGGKNFSGGQRQRLEIARALVNCPPVLILDEATSALDATTEQIIDQNLRQRGCTCLIVAHRLSTIRDCDEIVVLDHGKAIQRGTHADMIQQPDSPYARLIAAEVEEKSLES